MKPVALRSLSTLTLTLAAVLVASWGCGDRKPRLVPASADSLAAANDSLTILSRMAVQKWESGPSDQAAAISARVVGLRLEADASSHWSESARTLLDSLGVAAEVAGTERAAVVNLFQRTEVEGGSWPYFYWSEGDQVRMQTLEGRGMRLLDATVRGFENGAAGDSSQLAVLWNRKAGTGPQPLLLTWRHARGGRWDLAQTLGPDSLGGTGTGQFADRTLITKTFKATPWFDECTTCPHVYHERRFHWGPQGFVRDDDRVVPSPYAAFTSFVSALVAGDRDQAARYVADPSLVEFARRYEWHDPALGRWRAAPGTEANASEMVFFRGRSDAFRVTFQGRGDGWVVLGFESTTRSVE
ncbi:MAG: hypothetical protein ABL977_02060 [Candidatus Eisenbacteria bacterium]